MGYILETGQVWLYPNPYQTHPVAIPRLHLAMYIIRPETKLIKSTYLFYITNHGPKGIKFSGVNNLSQSDSSPKWVCLDWPWRSILNRDDETSPNNLSSTLFGASPKVDLSSSRAKECVYSYWGESVIQTIESFLLD